MTNKMNILYLKQNLKIYKKCIEISVSTQKCKIKESVSWLFKKCYKNIMIIIPVDKTRKLRNVVKIIVFKIKF